MKGILGRKVGMTEVFTKEGKVIPVTVIETEPNVVTQVKTVETDGYNAIQVATGDVREKHVNKPMKGHFNKAGVAFKKLLKEFRVENPAEFKVGQTISVDIFTDGQNINIYLGVIFGHIKEINEKAEMQVRESLKSGGLYYKALGKIDVVDVELKECKSELQKEHSLVSNNNDVIIVFDINSLVTINGNVQFSFEDANKENFVGEVELNMKGIVNTQISVNKSTMEISSVYSDEPDLFGEINKALLGK